MPAPCPADAGQALSPWQRSSERRTCIPFAASAPEYDARPALLRARASRASSLLPGCHLRDSVWEIAAPYERDITLHGRDLLRLPDFHRTGARSATDLARALALSPATTSFHTAALRRADLLATTRAGHGVHHHRTDLACMLTAADPATEPPGYRVAEHPPASAIVYPSPRRRSRSEPV